MFQSWYLLAEKALLCLAYRLCASDMYKSHTLVHVQPTHARAHACEQIMQSIDTLAKVTRAQILFVVCGFFSFVTNSR